MIFPIVQTFKQAKQCRFMIMSLHSHYLDREGTRSRIYPFFISSRSTARDGWLTENITTTFFLTSTPFLSAAKKARKQKSLSRLQSWMRLHLAGFPHGCRLKSILLLCSAFHSAEGRHQCAMLFHRPALTSACIMTQKHPFLSLP